MERALVHRKTIFVRYENSGSSVVGGNSKHKGRKASGHSIQCRYRNAAAIKSNC